MTKERRFYIAYRICDYVRSTNMQNQFEEHEFCMYVSNVANDIKCAIKEKNLGYIYPYYEMLNDELENVSFDSGYVEEITELITLLDECEVQLV